MDWIFITALCLLVPLSRGQLGSVGQPPQGAQISQAAQFAQGGTQPTGFPQSAAQISSSFSQGVAQGSQLSQGGGQLSQGGAQISQYPVGGPQATQFPLGATQGAQISQGAPQGGLFSQGAQLPQGAQQGAQFPQGAPQGGQFTQGAQQGAQFPQGAPQGGQFTQGGPQGGQFTQGAQQGGQFTQGVPQGAQFPQGMSQGVQYPPAMPQRPEIPQTWPTDKFMQIESNLGQLKMYVQSLQDLVYQERVKYPAPYPQNITAAPVDLSYTNFVNDADMRLNAMKNVTERLVLLMNTCARGLEPPSIPRNIMVQSETVDNTSNIFVSWDPPMLTGLPQVDDNLHYKVYFSPVDEYGQPKGGQMLFRICDANSTQASVTDLSPRSYYSIRIAAAHCLSVESEGDPTLVRTLDIIPSAPLNVRIEGKKANAIAVGWDPPAVMGTLTNYTIYVGEESGPVTTVAVDPSITTYAIYDLYEGTMYNVQVSASSDNGESPKSQPIQVITDAYVPMAPRNLRAIDHNLTSVTLRWDPPTPGPGMIRGYRVNFTTDTGFDNYQEVLTSGPSDTQVTITGLAPATLYYFQVYARTMKRLGMGSPVILNMTKADVPSKPMSVMHQLVDNGLQTIQLSWQPPNNTYGPILKYVLHWGVRGGATRKENLTAYILTWSSDLLDDNTTHDFKLSAVNELGEGEPTYLSIRTKAKPQIIPPNVRVTRRKGRGLNPTTLKVTWGAPKIPVDGFWILYRKFEWVYTGRWQLMTIEDPTARSAEISVPEEKVSYIVVCKGFVKEKKTTANPGAFSFPGVGNQQPYPPSGAIGLQG